MVRRRLWRDLLHRRTDGALMGPARRPLRPQADADPRQPRHGDRHVADRHGRDGRAAGGDPAPDRPARRLRFRLDDPGGGADAEGEVRLGARRPLLRHHGGQPRRPVDRRRAAAADRHPLDLSPLGRGDLRQLPRHDCPAARKAASARCASAAVRRPLGADPGPAPGRRDARDRPSLDLCADFDRADHHRLCRAVRNARTGDVCLRPRHVGRRARWHSVGRPSRPARRPGRSLADRRPVARGGGAAARSAGAGGQRVATRRCCAS